MNIDKIIEKLQKDYPEIDTHTLKTISIYAYLKGYKESLKDLTCVIPSGTNTDSHP